MDFLSNKKARWETSEFLSKEVTPLLAPVVERVLLERPTDVAGFLAKQFASQSGHSVISPLKKAPLAQDADGVEMDTADAETLNDDALWALLLPNGTLPGLSHPTITKFSISYSSSLLSGWVKQRSPGCAAASVAGAFNALRDLHRNAAGALSMDDVIGVLCDIQRDRAEKKRGRIERFLLGASLEPLSVVLRQYIFEHHEGKTLAGENKKTCCGKKIRNAALKKLIFLRRKRTIETAAVTLNENNASESNNDILSSSVSKEEISAESKYDDAHEDETPASASEPRPTECEVAKKVTGVPIEEWIHQAPVFVQIRELIEMKEQEQQAETASAHLLEVDATVEENEDDEEGEENDEEVRSSSTKKSSTSSNKSGSSDDFNWFKEVCGYFEIITGLEKLQRKKPSTAAFGNWGIVAAVRECSLVDDTGNFKAHPFMGRGARGSKIQNRISPSSLTSSGVAYEAELERQFQLLKLEHSHPNAVLLSHHKNHYALIYAVRDWTERIPVELTSEITEGSSSSSSSIIEGKYTDTDTVTNTTMEGKIDQNEEGFGSGSESKPMAQTIYRKRRVRQVLTARRGQRPSVWMDFEELRGMYLKWAGYRLMSVRYSPFEKEKSGFSIGHK
jgi:hypothetical protein